jgi:phenylpropionate dioxygenase-like ring-hydroxylating dioxygenase large terminal subunit
MLTAEENAQLTRVGPGTLMGDLMRQYWIPVVQSTELAPGGRVKRVKILGEDLVAYRSPGGRVGVLAEFCAHRRASLYFARNEERGLRCVYHGWQYDPCGRCVDMPNERPESNFQDKVTLPAYPCAERGGVVWTYMGPANPPPGLPDLEWALVPESQRFVSKFWQECNYLQALEGRRGPRAHLVPPRHPRRATTTGGAPWTRPPPASASRPSSSGRRTSRWPTRKPDSSSARGATRRPGSTTGASPSTCSPSTPCRRPRWERTPSFTPTCGCPLTTIGS